MFYEKKIKVFLWKIGLLREGVCPVCDKKLKPVGFNDYVEGQHYICRDDDCFFNEV